MSATETIRVDTPSRAYDVVVGRGLLAGVGSWVREACGGELAYVVTDEHVMPHYGRAVRRSLRHAGYTVAGSVVPAGERSKCVDMWASLTRHVADAQLTRDDVVVALGGGVVGDLAGFVAATYLRGCHVVQVPTSLLAMVDSSVGGKTAIDIPEGKNLVGAFLQPSLVVADVDCLATLSHEQLTDSCGEVIKHAVLASPGLFARISEHPVNGPDTTPDELARIVAENVTIKRDVVSADEREHGVRQTLNLGHTLGHAIEAASGYTQGHGSCVAAGLCMMARATESMGWSTPEYTRRVTRCVEAHGLPTGTDFDAETVWSFALHDKKRHGTTVNVVVARDVGDVAVRTVSLDTLHELVRLGCDERA